jgi:hypothetical protein
MLALLVDWKRDIHLSIRCIIGDIRLLVGGTLPRSVDPTNLESIKPQISNPGGRSSRGSSRYRRTLELVLQKESLLITRPA